MNFKKRLVVIGVILLVVLSTITFAEPDTSNSCAGVWGSIKCFLWGNPANRAGQSWWARGEALTGKADLQGSTLGYVGAQIEAMGGDANGYNFYRMSSGGFIAKPKSDSAPPGATQVYPTASQLNVRVTSGPSTYFKSDVLAPPAKKTEEPAQKPVDELEKAFTAAKADADAKSAAVEQCKTTDSCTTQAGDFVAASKKEAEAAKALEAAKSAAQAAAPEPVASPPEPAPVAASPPSDVPGDAIYISVDGFWVVSPSGTCTSTDKSGCGKVYDAVGTEKKGLLYTGINYVVAEGYTWKDSEDTNNLEVTLLSSATPVASPPAPAPAAAAPVLGQDLVLQANALSYDQYAEKGDLYQQACGLGNGAGCANLGTMYEYGDISGAPNLPKAKEAYEQACSLGNQLGCVNLGHAYREGWAGGKEPDKAVTLYQTACDGGNEYGCSFLGEMYEDGDGVLVNLKKATELFQLACDKGMGGDCDKPGVVKPAPAAAPAEPAPSPPWNGDEKSVKGWGGDNAVYVEDGKVWLDCGTWCFDDEVTVNPKTGQFEVNGKVIPDEQVYGLGDNTAVTKLKGEQEKVVAKLGKEKPGAPAPVPAASESEAPPSPVSGTTYIPPVSEMVGVVFIDQDNDGTPDVVSHGIGGYTNIKKEDLAYYNAHKSEITMAASIMEGISATGHETYGVKGVPATAPAAAPAEPPAATPPPTPIPQPKELDAKAATAADQWNKDPTNKGLDNTVEFGGFTYESQLGTKLTQNGININEIADSGNPQEIAKLQALLGLTPTGKFDGPTLTALKAQQQDIIDGKTVLADSAAASTATAPLEAAPPAPAPAPAPAPPPTVTSPPTPLTDVAVTEAETWNLGIGNANLDSFSGITTGTSSGTPLEDALDKNGIDAYEIVIGNPQEIAKLQALLEQPVTGKLNDDTLTALKAQQQDIIDGKKVLKGSAAETAPVSPSATPPVSPPPPPPVAPPPTLEQQQQEIKTALTKGEITHAEAAEKLKPLVEQAKKAAEKEYKGSNAYKKYTEAQKALSDAGVTNVPDYLKDIKSTTLNELDDDKLNTLVTAIGATVKEGANKEDKITAIEEKVKLLKEADEKANKDANKDADELQETQERYDAQSFWLEGLEQWYAPVLPYTSLAGALGTFAAKLGSYQALSNLMFGTEFSQNWLVNADSEFWSSAGWRWTVGIDQQLMREVCDYDEAKRSKSPGQSAVFILDPYGTAQSVGAIRQAEKSDTKSPILCERNTAPEAESEWKCAKKQVCVNDFCYADEDENGEADSEDPIKGYFYKITWGVTAPADQANTPYVDENGIAVKFNIKLSGEKSTWIFKKVGTPQEQVLELKNGNSDGGTIVKYLPDKYNEVCIEFYTKMKDIDGDEIGEFCADFVISTKGVVEYGGSDRTSSVTSTSPEVEMDI